MPKIPAGATYKPVQIPDGATYDTAAPDPTNGTTIGPLPPFASRAWLKSTAYTLADKATNLLPAAGGIGGGLLGAPGGPAGMIAGATIGGGGAEAARQLLRRGIGFESPQTSSDAAEGIGSEGLRQGAYEASGQVLGRAGKAIAPKLAEAAVAPGKRMLKSLPPDVNIGQTLLDETSGFRPKAIVGELDKKIADADYNVTGALDAARNRGVKVDLFPARQEVANELLSAKAKNAPQYIDDVGKVGNQLATDYSSGVPLPRQVDPVRARALKQGVDLTIGNWNPESQSAIAPLQERVRGIVNRATHTAVPETEQWDKQMTSLIPTRDAAWNTSFNPGVMRNVVEKFARPTGALVGGLAGAQEGYDLGGTEGAIAGGLGGLLIPAAAASPTGMMLGARAFESQLPARALRYTIPVAESQRKRETDSRSAVENVRRMRQRLQPVR